jgi:hypothetical protein
MPNARFRMHGGLSTGPRMPEGLEAIRRSRTIHGFYSRTAIEQRRQARTTRRLFAHLLDQLRAPKKLSPEQGPHRCGPAHSTLTTRLRLALPPAARTHTHEGDGEEGQSGWFGHRRPSSPGCHLKAADEPPWPASEIDIDKAV